MSIWDWFRGQKKSGSGPEAKLPSPPSPKVALPQTPAGLKGEPKRQAMHTPSARPSASPTVAKDPASHEPTTLIQWLLLPVPEELQAQEDMRRQENINALIHSTVNHVANNFKGLCDWQASQVRDGSVVSFSCHAPVSVDAMAVKRFLDETWDHYCKEATRLLKGLKR